VDAASSADEASAGEFVQRRLAVGGLDVDVASNATITTVGGSIGIVSLSVKGDATVAAAAGVER
jgi:hypothetical protein